MTIINGRLVTGAMLAAIMAIGLAGSALGQDTIEIRADGPTVADSAAGADNVRVELNPGRQQAVASQGQGNQEIRRAPTAGGERQRGDRDRNRAGNSGGGGGGEGGVADAAPEAAPGDDAQNEPQAPAPAAADMAPQPRPVQLPSTGAGAIGSVASLGVLLGAAVAAVGGWVVRRRV